MMKNGDPQYAFFCSHLTPMKDSYCITFMLFIEILEGEKMVFSQGKIFLSHKEIIPLEHYNTP